MIHSTFFPTVTYRIPRRSVGTLEHAPHHHHSIKPVAGFLAGFLAAAWTLTVMAFAPAHDFDDLDCHSYCQQYLHDETLQ